MNCPKCSAQAEPGDEFCVCGEPLVPAAPSEKVSAEQASPASGERAKSGLFQPPGAAAAPPPARSPAPEPPKPRGGLFRPPSEGGGQAPRPTKKATGLFAAPIGTGTEAKSKPVRPNCTECGGNDIDAAGLCTNCGTQVVFAPRDDFRVKLSPKLAVRSFIGRIHNRNEDFAVAAQETVNGVTYSIMIVADGVSSAERSHLASEKACKAAREEVISQLRKGQTDMREVVLCGIDCAQAAVLEIPCVGELNARGEKKAPPEATILIAIVANSVATLGWLGDCRAYACYQHTNGWNATLLTKDHSWINLVVDAKQMTVEEAENDQRAHQIFQSLGPVDESCPLEPSTRSFDLQDYKYLIVCSDGFWNYGHPHQNESAQPLIALLTELGASCDAQTVAERLVSYANDIEGRDNITVIVQSS